VTTGLATEAPTLPSEEEWLEHNQTALAWELEDLRSVLTGSPPPDRPGNRDGVNASAVDIVVEAFGLSSFERSVLVLCAGVELDTTVAEACASVGTSSSDHGSTGCPTFRMALATLPGAHWSALTPDGPLRRWRLVGLDSTGSLTTAPLRIDERVLHFLTGLMGTDPNLAGIVTPAPAGAEVTESQHAATEILTALWQVPGAPLPVLTGATRDSRRAVAHRAARQLGLHLSLLDPALLPPGPAGQDDLARLLEREGVLAGTAFLLEDDVETARALVDAATGLTQAKLAVSTARSPHLTRRTTRIVEVPRPTASEQHLLWGRVAPGAPGVGALVAAFDLDATSITTAAAVAQAGGEDLWSTCRAMSRPRLDAYAQRVRSAAGWQDLVLPEAQLTGLRMLGARARHRVTVYDDWALGTGRDTGLGSAVVFSGPSGTGKSMAAAVLANDLGLDLYRVDLSAVVSKYVGETERNLRRVFDAADEGAAVLLFDEADALFGKRTEVRDSHDRYANVEVSYLLQRMEAYRGLAILTTNMAQAIDAAFLRRLCLTVTFPFPDRQLQRELWRRVFPPQTPTGELDLEALSGLDLSGGTIRNAAVNAAFLAAAQGDIVRMDHIRQAARLEYHKLGRTLGATRSGAQLGSDPP
jgi:hypothetical protein